jgi:hypothetical protein
MLASKPRSVNPYRDHIFDKADGPPLPPPLAPSPRQLRLLALLDPVAAARLLALWRSVGLLAPDESEVAE